MISLLPFVSVFLYFAYQAAAQAVFAHVILGNNGAYDLAQWQSDIRLAAKHGIDGFVLNIAPPVAGLVDAQTSLAFQAANNVNATFRLFFSFDYLGGGTPWSTDNIISLLHEYASNKAYYQYNGKPFVSTFEGPSNSDVNDWTTIRSAISTGIYLVPDWTSKGPGFHLDLIDGSFNWNIWPDGPSNMSLAVDEQWLAALKPASKTYMMGVSPWYYTDLPAYSKAWVWRGDSLWYNRWQQVLDILPPHVEIVSWNDFGESHYIGPIHQPGIPHASDADARSYVNGFPHQAWLKALPYQIAAYKHAFNNSNPAPKVGPGDDKIVYWYRTSPASAGSTGVTGNCCSSGINTGGYQECYPVSEVLEDKVFAIALLSCSGSVSVTIGNGTAHVFDGLVAGINYISRPYHGDTGVVTVQSSAGVSGSGVDILSGPVGGIANFNAWVGCAGSCA